MVFSVSDVCVSACGETRDKQSCEMMAEPHKGCMMRLDGEPPHVAVSDTEHVL